MSNFTNREALYSAYLNTDQLEWEHLLGQLATEGQDIPHKLYYLSLDPSLNGPYILDVNFEDKLAMNGDQDYRELFTIALPYRLLTSPDLQGCWNQVYSRIKHCFAYETDITKPIDLYLYEVDVSDCVVIDSTELTNNYLVHDAYTNHTHAVFGHPILKQVKHLKVKNTLGYPDECCTYYYPFNDGRYIPSLLSTPLEFVEG